MNDTPSRFCGYCGSPMAEGDSVCGCCGMRMPDLSEEYGQAPEFTPSAAAGGAPARWDNAAPAFSDAPAYAAPHGTEPPAETHAFTGGRFDRQPAAPAHTPGPARVSSPVRTPGPARASEHGFASPEAGYPGSFPQEPAPAQPYAPPTAAVQDASAAPAAAPAYRPPVPAYEPAAPAYEQPVPAAPAAPAYEQPVPAAPVAPAYEQPAREPAAPAYQPTAPAYAPPAPVVRTDRRTAQTRKSGLSPWLLLPAALLLIALTAFVTWFITKKSVSASAARNDDEAASAETAQDPAGAVAAQYFEYSIQGDQKSADRLSYADVDKYGKDFTSYMVDQGYADFDVDKYYEFRNADTKSSLSYRYGENCKTDHFQYLYVEKWPEEKVAYWLSDYENATVRGGHPMSDYVAFDKLTEIATVTVSYTAEGSRKGEAVIETVDVGKFGDTWKVLEPPFYAKDRNSYYYFQNSGETPGTNATEQDRPG